MEYSGVLTAGALDQVANSSGNNTAGTTGTTPTTTQANELWVGGIGLVNANYTLTTTNNGFTSPANAATTSGSTSVNAKVYALEKIVTTTGAASSGGTVSASSQWSGAIATFKANYAILTLAGADAGNYSLTPSGSVTVSQYPLTVTATANTKLYNGTTSAAAIPTLTTGSSSPATRSAWRRPTTPRTWAPARRYPGRCGHGRQQRQQLHLHLHAGTTGVINVTTLTITAAATPRPTTAMPRLPPSPPTRWAPCRLATRHRPGRDLRHQRGHRQDADPGGLTVSDGNSGGNYHHGHRDNHRRDRAKATLTVTAATNTKTYDGTTRAAAIAHADRQHSDRGHARRSGRRLTTPRTWARARP